MRTQRTVFRGEIDYLSLLMNSARAANINCWMLNPAAAAADRIALPVSLSGLMVIESREEFHFAEAFLCASVTDI